MAIQPQDDRAFTEEQWAELPFDPRDIRKVIRRLDRRDDQIEQVLKQCAEIAKPYAKGRKTKFGELETLLVKLYRELLPLMLRKPFPLVVVDEAHNWRNGANGYKGFVKSVACRTRRALLLTATPFQLRPDEMLEILKVSDHLRVCPDTRRHR